MWEVSRIMCLGALTGLSVVDILYRKIPGEILALGMVGALAYHLVARETDPWILAGGAGVGLLFLLVSRITREGIGYGDSWAVLDLGLYLGLWKLLEVLAGTFFLLFAASVAALARKRMSRKSTLPFFPFLASGYLMVLLGGGTLW